MKAYEINEFGIENLSLIDRPALGPEENEVLIEFRAASLNFRDLMVVEGTYNPRMKLPAVPFSDAAGEIVDVGSGVTRWKVGDRVMPIMVQRWFDGEPDMNSARTAIGAGAQWDGVLREVAAFDQEAVVRVPDHLSYEEASTLPCAAVTAWNALVVSGRIKAGDTVLTLGTGGVSIFALQIAKMFGAEVIATSSSNEKIARLMALGADHCINYRERDDWPTVVMELTGKRGVDHVVEVGGAGTLAKSVASARIAGHVAMIGALAGNGDFNPINAFMKALRLQGIFVGSRAMFESMNRAFAENDLKPVVDRVFEFGEVRDALRYMADGSHFGKIVVRI